MTIRNPKNDLLSAGSKVEIRGEVGEGGVQVSGDHLGKNRDLGRGIYCAKFNHFPPPRLPRRAKMMADFRCITLKTKCCYVLYPVFFSFPFLFSLPNRV